MLYQEIFDNRLPGYHTRPTFHQPIPGRQHDVKPGMWVRFRGDKWTISTLGEYSFQKTYLGLKASIAKGVSG